MYIFTPILIRLKLFMWKFTSLMSRCCMRTRFKVNMCTLILKQNRGHLLSAENMQHRASSTNPICSSVGLHLLCIWYRDHVVLHPAQLLPINTLYNTRISKALYVIIDIYIFIFCIIVTFLLLVANVFYYTCIIFN